VLRRRRVRVDGGFPLGGEDGARTAVDAFEEVGAPHEVLATLEHLVEVVQEGGDAEAAAWLDRAHEEVGDAPDPVAERHDTWEPQRRVDLDAA
jgi:hypothetical protein